MDNFDKEIEELTAICIRNMKTLDNFDKEIEELTAICIRNMTPTQGHFLTCIFDAFLSADKANTRLMLPLMKELKKKYDLKKEVT